jgi:hypothetical protein
MLPVFLKTLSDVRDALAYRGLIYVPPPEQTTHMERGAALALGGDSRPRSQAARQHRRVPLNIRGECRLIDKKDFWPGRPVVGEVMNVSLGGAQVRLPRRFPRSSQVELFMVVDGMLFRGRAEIAGADTEVQSGASSGQFRHSLRWVSLEGHAKDILTKVVAARTPKRVDDAQ